MSWAPGPMSCSIEAIYPFAIFGKRVVYHAPSHVGTIMTSLNLAKRRHPILVLPLVTQLLRTRDEPSFEACKATWSYVNTALGNVGTMGTIFNCHMPHKRRTEKLQQRTQDKQRAILEHMRTGSFGPVLGDELSKWSLATLFPFPSAQRQGARGRDHAENNATYKWLVKIGRKYGLARDEFDEWCTVPTPGPAAGRVFYPSHVLSRHQAEAMSWDWSHVCHIASKMLSTMRRRCNKHAEQAGFGENAMNPLRLV